MSKDLVLEFVMYHFNLYDFFLSHSHVSLVSERFNTVNLFLDNVCSFNSMRFSCCLFEGIWNSMYLELQDSFKILCFFGEIYINNLNLNLVDQLLR